MTKTIISIIAVVLAGCIFFLYTRPTYDAAQVDQLQINQYNAALDKAAELQTIKQTLLSRYNAFSPSDIDRLQKLLPDHVDNVALILDLDNLASQYALPLENVDVATPANSTAGQSAIGSLGASGHKYDSLTIRFSTLGTYTQFLQFMTQLEASLRIVDLVSLALTGTGGTGINGDPAYHYDVTLRTYWLK